ncbi:MAG: hypothetical protein FWG75_06265 [Cystobacterineae bacterium]|nr:hypothetical protein [Cystobacterineae bacterium]
MKHVWLFFALLLAAFSACKPTSSSPSKPLGERLVAGHISELRLLPGETHVRFLADAKSPNLKETASSLKLGKLYLYNLQTRQLTQIGQQVASLMETQHATEDGKYLVFLDQFNPKTKTGSLHCAGIASAVAGNALGEEVSFFVVSAQEQRLAFVDKGILKVGPLPEGPFHEVDKGIANAEFSQDGNTLAFQKKGEDKGQLWVVDLKEAERKPRLMAEYTGDYRLSKDGKKLLFTARKTPQEMAFQLFFVDMRGASSPKLLSQEVFRFLWSPDERFVAYVETQKPERPGTLWLRPLTGAGEAKALGERVRMRDFDFASNSGALAWREGYSGDDGLLSIVVLQGDLEPKWLAPRTRHWQWSPQGNALAYTATVPTPNAGVSVDLFSFRLGDKAPTKLHAWVYNYAFSVDGEKILFRANCSREGRSCELLSSTMQEDAPKEKLAEGVFSFLQSADGQAVYWLHVTPVAPVQNQLWAREIGAKEANTPANPQKLADHVHLPPPLAIDKTGKKFLYISNHLQQEGLYLSELKP